LSGHETLLAEIGTYCQRHRMAESTFGRLAVNDGKLVARLRDGKSVTLNTLERLRDFMKSNDEAAGAAAGNGFADRASGIGPAAPTAMAPAPSAAKPQPAPGASADAPPPSGGEDGKNFRFFDNRQKYLMFVNTCSEKWVVANRVAMELAHIHPRPPAVRIFDAGLGDGTVLTRLMRAMHARFPTMPHYISGKEISLEDIRLALEKMPDRFYEHPASVLVLTNMYYSEAPWLRVRSPAAANSLVWHEVALDGASSFEFEEQITALQPFLAEHWQAKTSAKTGNPIYERPVVLVIYRRDHRFLLDSVIPRQGATGADFDMIVASQPYRLRVPAEFKASKVVAPLARALGPGGRLVGIHSHGDDPGLEIVQKVWPEEQPYLNDRHDILKAVKELLGSSNRDLKYNAYSDARSIFRYDMHTLPNELAGAIGTSTLFAAWNAAIYVAQIEDGRLSGVVKDGRYIDATAEVLRKHGGLWFNDETYVISRRQN
jgi:SAM-dependent methyltransferase